MREVLTFLVEMVLISGTFFLGYKLVFHHSTATFRRGYLLAWLVFSIAFPLITIEIPISSPVPLVSVQDFVAESTPALSFESNDLSATTQADITPKSVKTAAPKQAKLIEWGFVIPVGYLLVVLALLLRIVLGYFQVWKLKKTAELSNIKAKRSLR